MIFRHALTASVLIGTLTAGMAIGALAQGNQVHMNNALASLRDAKKELALGLPNKGGHREKAIDLTNQAIDEVYLAIRAGRGR